MSREMVFKCDICGRVRGEANHWFLAWRLEGESWVMFAPWDDEQAKLETMVHLCSEECAHKHLSRSLASGRAKGTALVSGGEPDPPSQQCEAACAERTYEDIPLSRSLASGRAKGTALVSGGEPDPPSQQCEAACAERTYEDIPPACEFCGPVCYGGAEHHARVEDGARYRESER